MLKWKREQLYLRSLAYSDRHKQYGQSQSLLIFFCPRQRQTNAKGAGSLETWIS